MAFSNSGSTYHSNAVPGLLEGLGEASIYDIDANAKFAVGTGFKRQDGNIYRYVNTISGVAAGKLCSHVVADVDNKYATSVITAGSAATQQASEQVGVYPGALGSRFVLYVLASTVKDQFAGGYFVTGRGTGAGYSYRIKGNTAAATVNAVANTVIIELYETIQVALDANTYVSVIGNLFNDVNLARGAGTNYIPVGVAQATLTANKYGWVCTHGVTQCLAGGTLTGGCAIQASVAVDGAVSQYGVGTTSNASNTLFVSTPLGYCIDPAADTYYATIFLV